MPDNSSSSTLVMNIDGASRGNPGPASYGVAIRNSQGERLAGLSGRLGRATNNFAEYQALIAALEYALKNGHARVEIRSDSELLVYQMSGSYKVKSPTLRPLHDRAQQLARRFERFSVRHVPREENREADRLANQALDGAPPHPD
ncbi:MAG TPA: ribonuclease HI family protein [Terriglobia bacterium]|nr:ribonuclease HI family protein [Terriglobia bacterium]